LAGDVVFGDDMHGRFLRRGGAAVDPYVVGAVIGSGICGIGPEGDEPTCASVADLIVDKLAIAVGAVTDPVAIPPVGHVGHLTGQPARQTFMGARFTGGQPPGPQFSRTFRGE
jgi:hypothetical protein